jgi:ABC-type Fe3+-hydroxamate transport system substrate-binding protein
MKKYVLALSVILCTVMFAIAQEKPTEQPKPESQATAKAQSGEVVSIDATKNEIVIKDAAGAEVRLLISTSTKITKAGKTIALGDVKVGDKVTSECEATADGCKAKSLAVMPPSQ